MILNVFLTSPTSEPHIFFKKNTFHIITAIKET